ncbi:MULTISPECIES: hypothetical protein [unclassified Myxococcus]|uniref:hypothetical protein n=1 Tax=unclassified Myxococcus TaxID=2648731 RepID=UPI00157B5562|nr:MULTISPECIES: hypothetical protein [unclassified Myxococcus]NTX01648.1 hypothetical protein [Myxococcus sp. CA040A]NTX40203.1 hypothetical protein [Myxococcus sp. CA033]NTX55028.1 hypothetical protein [Myxococcus sp. CA039A]
MNGALVVGCLTAVLMALPAHADDGDLDMYSYPVLLLLMLEVFWPVLLAAVVAVVALCLLWRAFRRRANRRAPVRGRGVRRDVRPSK